ncbi:Conserved oligomeric Golgi complex subunit 7 [Trypanosoma melophagium]|uniref:Conserved oligomeric Golgi complex subunit 7 n=1 Tax=Trypanosoma melophagium TaxID=715481 RepID=UPI00351A4FFE|nr:Conserved oligomeric Golgi complex subunit 7 [Trypanosoma melophagium]
MQSSVSSQKKGGSTGTEPGVHTGSGAIRLEQLASEHLDIKRWINTSLQSLKPTESTSEGNDAEVEARVTQLFNRLQSYLQEVGGSVEDTITQALVRLPRTGLEVGRMATDAQQLHQQLQTMQEVVQSAVEAAAKPYVAQLNAFKKTQDKLTRCADMLRKASEVASDMKQLDDVMQQLHTTPTEVDMDAVAVTIGQLRSNLAELQKVDVTFGEKQQEAVERYEQTVQHAIEVECMEKLRRREVNRAAQLLKVLDAIGCAEVILQQYAVESMMSERERVERLLGENGAAVSTISAARAAEVLKTQLMPSIGHVLADHLDFLLCMVQAEEGDDVDVKFTEKNSTKYQETEARTVKVLQLMVDEVSGSIAKVLVPVLDKVERNQDLVLCCDAMRQLKIGDETNEHNKNKNGKNTSQLREKIAKQISAYAISEMIQLFAQSNILEAFTQREAYRLEALVKDPQITVKRERFKAAMDLIMDAVKGIVRFFPDKTLPMCVARWREAILETISRLRPTPRTPQESLLERLSAARTVVRQLLLTGQKNISDYLSSPELQRLYPSVADAVDTQLRTQFWAPLIEALDNCVQDCQYAVKRTIIEPVIAKADGYESQPLWGVKQGEGGHDETAGVSSPPFPYTAAQVAPTELVRALGEAIVEIPLALEGLRGDGDVRFEGIEELLEEVAEFWLDDIVRTAVADFIEKKVGNITIYFPDSQPDAAKKEAAAVEQLATDLGYLKSVLAAVSDDPFEELERALTRLKAVRLPAGKPISVRRLITGGER